MPYRIAIVGAGGVGGFFGGALAAKTDAHVSFLVREGAHGGAMRSAGLKVDSSMLGSFVVNPCDVHTSAESIGEVDAVIVCVKSYQLEAVAPTLKPLLRKSPPTAVVPLLNGMDAPKVLTRVLGKEHALGGLAKIFAWIDSPGCIVHKGDKMDLAFGELDGSKSTRVDQLSAMFTKAEVPHVVPPGDKGGIVAQMWGKFVFICAISGATAISRANWGEICDHPRTKQIYADLLREGFKVGAAHGVKACEGDMMFNMFMKMSEGFPPTFTASLARDMIAGKPSELEGQLGHMVELAAQKKVYVPVASTIYAALLPMEAAATAAAKSPKPTAPAGSSGTTTASHTCVAVACIAAGALALRLIKSR